MDLDSVSLMVDRLGLSALSLLRERERQLVCCHQCFRVLKSQQYPVLREHLAQELLRVLMPP